MPERKIYRSDKGITFFYMPAFLRDKFDMQKGDIVNVDTDGDKIIVEVLK